jgi:hypothetical protein
MEEKKQEEYKQGAAQSKRPSTKAPPPVREVAGHGSWSPKRTHAPLDFSLYYPPHLIPQATVIINEALAKFPVQTRTLELCRHVISELTQPFCAMVRQKKLEPAAVLSRMGDLVHYLLVANCDNDSERFKLKQETRDSDEWTKLAKEVLRVSSAAGNDPAIEEPPRPASGQGATGAGMQSEEEIWSEIDHKLVALMVDRIEREMNEEYGRRRDEIYPNENTPEPAYRFPLKVAKLCVERTKESVSGYFQIYGQVWERQGKTRTSSFVRAVFARALLPSLDKGIDNVKEVLKHPALRNHTDDETFLWGEDIIQDACRLKESWQNSIEIEASEREWEERKRSGVKHPPAEQSAAPEVPVFRLEHDFREPTSAPKSEGQPVPPPRGIILSERIEREQEKNDRLRLEIEDLKAQGHSLLWSSGSLVQAFALSGPMRERERQLKESDQRLAELKSQKQEIAGTGTLSAEPSRWHVLDKHSPERMKRLTIIRQSLAQDSNFSAEDLCKRLDLANHPPLEVWQEEHEVTTWSEAYEKPELRGGIQSMFSKDKRDIGRLTDLPSQK